MKSFLTPFQVYVLLVALVIFPCPLRSQIEFISIDPNKLTAKSGENIDFTDESTLWNWLPNEGNGGVLESTREKDQNASPLIMWLDDLEPGESYEIFGYFWAPQVKDTKNKPKHWPARFGLSLASLTPYGGHHLEKTPFIIGPGSKISDVHGLFAVPEKDDPFFTEKSALSSSSGQSRLIRCRIGVARSGDDGRIPVFMDDFPDSIHTKHTRIDGVAMRKAPAAAEPSSGAGTKRALHFALRTKDHVSVKRELAAGADPNSLDANGLAPLFHSAIIGDLDMVKLLLQAGSDPNVEGQSILVLTGATSVGNTEIVKLLLDSGAEVPAGRIKPQPWMKLNLRDNRLHPAIAAIRSGSLSSLKLLLEKRPDLDLDSLGATKHRNGMKTPFLVCDAMGMGYDRMAAFLINHGCSLEGAFSWYNQKKIASIFNHDIELYNGYISPEILLSISVLHGKYLIKSRNALLERGISPVLSERFQKLRVYFSGGWISGLPPLDGLSAAIYMGDEDLTRKFLPAAVDVTTEYQRRLHAIARWSGDPEIYSMIKKQFPDAASVEYSKIVKEHKNEDSDALRLLLPRTAPKTESDSSKKDTWTFAVLTSPKTSGQAAHLEVVAAGKKEWKVVDRQQIENVLHEDKISDWWGNGKHRLADIGDRMSADLLILVSLIDSPDLSLLRFEAVDVLTGLVVYREHIDRNQYDPNKSSSPLLARIRSAFLKARSGERPSAISILPLSVKKDIPRASALESIFRAAVHGEVDATPGLLSVGMEQIRAISDEQKLAGKNNMWAAAYTLEGAVESIAKDQIAVKLRLRSMNKSEDKFLDVIKKGSKQNLSTLVSEAWKEMITSNRLISSKLSIERPTKKQSQREAKRLLRESEWLMQTGMIKEANTLLNRASLLGADPLQLVNLHLQALAADVEKLLMHENKRNNTITGRHLDSLGKLYSSSPLAIDHQNRLLGGLEEARLLLDQAAFYQLKYGDSALQWVDPYDQIPTVGGFLSFWNVVKLLSLYNASIPKILPEGIAKQEVLSFQNDLGNFTKDYFRVRSMLKTTSLAPRHKSDHMSAAMFRRNQELLEGWANQLIHAEANQSKRRLPRVSLLEQLTGNKLDSHFDYYGKNNYLFEKAHSRIENDYDGDHYKLRIAGIEAVFPQNGERADSVNRFVRMRSNLSRRNYARSGSWVYLNEFKHFGTGVMLDKKFKKRPFQPLNHDEIISSLIHEPRGSLDWIAHPGYHSMNKNILRFEERNNNSFKNSFISRYTKKAKQVINELDASTKLLRILEVAKDVELVYGYPIYDPLVKKLEELYPDKMGITKHQSANAKLLTDFRKTDEYMPGLFEFPLIDEKNRNLMWFKYQSFEEKPERPWYKASDSDLVRPVGRHPRLIGVECVSGEITMDADLNEAPGPGPQLGDWYVFGGNFRKVNLAQNDDFLLVNHEWEKGGVLPLTREKVGVLVRKSDGHMITLDPPAAIGRTQNFIDGSYFSTAAVGIGDKFYFLNEVKGHEKSSLRNHFELTRVGPNGKVKPITKYGRRPAMTPFDAIDRMPKMIMRDRNKLFVVNNKSRHIGWYDYKNDEWKISEKNHKKNVSIAKKIHARDYRKFIYPHHKVNGSKICPTIYIRWGASYPNALSCETADGHKFLIRVGLDMPENILDQHVFTDSIMNNDKGYSYPTDYWTYASKNKNERYGLVVLNQTKTDIILALQVDNAFWSPGRRSGVFLPLLWSLPIDEFRSYALNNIEEDNEKNKINE